MNVENDRVDIMSILSEVQRGSRWFPQKSFEVELSDFMYLMNNAVYTRRESRLNYLQQKEIHDMAITFPEVICEHQLVAGDFDADCVSCSIR